MEYLLHIDTSGDNGLVGVAANGQPLTLRTITDSRNQAALINNLIDEVLVEAGINMQQLSAVVVCAGPGSYTGLRIGMATAKAICYVADIPLIADNKLTLLAYQAMQKHPSHKNYFALLEAREKEYFFAAYDSEMSEVSEPSHVFEDVLMNNIGNYQDIVITGHVYPEKQDFLRGENIYIVPGDILNFEGWATYSFNQYKCNRTVNLASAEPFYLKQVYTHNPKIVN